MIFTVFTAPANPGLQWRAELLEDSWRRVRQPGELIRLAPLLSGESLPGRRAARIVEVLRWNPHPYTGDSYVGYETPAAVLEWSFRERAEGTVLLLDASCVLRHQVTQEVTPGKVLASEWPEMPLGAGGPFGLRPDFRFLECFCVNRELPLAPVRLPILIHTSDLRRIAARWLELTAIIRAERTGPHGYLDDADRVAYAIAAAEYRLLHALVDLGIGTDGTGKDAPVIDYRRPVEAASGEIVWDERVYRPWEPVYPEKAHPGAGRDFLALLNEMITRRESGADLSVTRPQRRPGVREARILDDVRLEVPGCPDLIALNSSAAVIWELCDGKRTLAEVVSELERRFDAPRKTLCAAVESTARELAGSGALELEDLLR